MRRAHLNVGVLLVSAAISASGEPASAPAGKIYCCIDAQQHNVCGNPLPRICYGRGYREVSKQGVTLRHVDAPLSAEQRAQRAAEEARDKKEGIALREAQYRDRALLSAYASEKDIDYMRDHAVQKMTQAVTATREKLVQVQENQKALEAERVSFASKPLPDRLKTEIQANKTDLDVLQAALDARNQEMEQVKNRFADDRRRFLELKQGIKKTPVTPPAAAE